jgi:hypothetical protein
MFFGSQRAVFLEFLRNLTPQVLFFTVALITGSQLDLGHLQFDGQGIKNAAPYLLSVTVFMAALVANTTLFIEKAVSSSERLEVELIRIRATPIKRRQKLLKAIAASWIHNKIAFIEIVLAALSVQAGFVVVAFMAFRTAITALGCSG